jgi:hypothetical protein
VFQNLLEEAAVVTFTQLVKGIYWNVEDTSGPVLRLSRISLSRGREAI